MIGRCYKTISFETAEEFGSPLIENKMDMKTKKVSPTDPESGWLRKGEHKHVFSYSIETACDKNRWILDYAVNPINDHDSRTFQGLYTKPETIRMKYCMVYARYKILAIAK